MFIAWNVYLYWSVKMVSTDKLFISFRFYFFRRFFLSLLFFCCWWWWWSLWPLSFFVCYGPRRLLDYFLFAFFSIRYTLYLVTFLLLLHRIWTREKNIEREKKDRRAPDRVWSLWTTGCPSNCHKIHSRSPGTSILMQTHKYKSTLVKSRTHQTKTATADTSVLNTGA